MIDEALKAAGATDVLIREMGPAATWLFSWVFAYVTMQAIKFMFEDTAVRRWLHFRKVLFALAVAVTFGYEYWLGGIDTWPMMVGLAFGQPTAYKISMAWLRARKPELAVGYMAGSLEPSDRELAAARRVGKSPRVHLSVSSDSGTVHQLDLDTQQLEELDTQTLLALGIDKHKARDDRKD